VLVFLSLELTFRRSVAIISRAVRTNRRSEPDRVSIVQLSEVPERTVNGHQKLTHLGHQKLTHPVATERPI
jgi:hypothetical protein